MEDKKLLKTYIILLILTILTFLPCLFFCHLDEMLVVDGEIRPENDESSIKNKFSGVVTNVYYKNSQFINKGDLLFELNSTYEKQQLSNYEKLEQTYKSEESELNKLLTLINKCDNNLPFDDELAFSNAKCSVFISEYKRYKKNLEVVKKNYERKRILFPQAISKAELEENENSYYQAEYSFISWFENQKIQSRKQYFETISNLQDCHIQMMKINRNISNSQVFAPESGYINEEIKIKAGDYIYEGEEILTIIPGSDNLKCLAFIPSSNISKIKIGQEVIVQAMDLPWTKYGKVLGTISLIPPDSTKNVFPIEIKLHQNYIKDCRNEKVFFHVGGLTRVRIKISENTIIQKILQMVIENG